MNRESHGFKPWEDVKAGSQPSTSILAKPPPSRQPRRASSASRVEVTIAGSEEADSTRCWVVGPWERSPAVRARSASGAVLIRLSTGRSRRLHRRCDARLIATWPVADQTAADLHVRLSAFAVVSRRLPTWDGLATA